MNNEPKPHVTCIKPEWIAEGLLAVARHEVFGEPIIANRIRIGSRDLMEGESAMDGKEISAR